jgi:hypothetical protein
MHRAQQATHLGGQHHALARFAQRVANNMFRAPEPIMRSSIDIIDAEIDGMAHQRATLFSRHGIVVPGQRSAAQAQCRDHQIRPANRPFFKAARAHKGVSSPGK